MNKRKAARAVELVLPATSANLGPAFDAAALAFRLYLKLHAESASEFSITARGRDKEICGRVENHLILNTYREVLQAERRSIIPLRLRINNEMPIGKGCGSSAAARLAGIALAVYFGRLEWNDDGIVGEASRREHHPDNAAACWMGGLAIARMSSESGTQVAKFSPKGKWRLLFAVPKDPLSTEEARRVLPVQYSREDTVSNLQNSLMLLASFIQGNHQLLASALDDHLHQPFRAPLCPLLPAIQELAGKFGILGAVLSGAGPSVLVFLHPKAAAISSKAEVSSHLRKRGLAAELILTSIAERGARDSVSFRRK